jgi:TetR/AcrR family transcriptional regulator, transcriptional repressor for nem operon
MPPPTRDNLVDAAARLFHEQGFAATGVATILREADVNSGSLYHFFPTKEALLVGVLERYVENLRPIVMDPVETQAGDPIERVFTLLAWYRGLMQITGCKLWCPIGNLALELSDSHPQVRELIDLNFANWVTAVRQWLEAAGNRLPADCDRQELAQMVLNTMEGGIMQARSRAGLAPFDAAVNQLRRYFEYLQRDAQSSRAGQTKSGSNSTSPADATDAPANPLAREGDLP